MKCIFPSTYTYCLNQYSHAGLQFTDRCTLKYRMSQNINERREESCRCRLVNALRPFRRDIMISVWNLPRECPARNDGVFENQIILYIKIRPKSSTFSKQILVFWKVEIYFRMKLFGQKHVKRYSCPLLVSYFRRQSRYRATVIRLILTKLMILFNVAS